MAYDNTSKKATIKYIKEKQKEIRIRFKNEEYYASIEPAVKKSGLPVATFIKQAIYEKIERSQN